MGINTGYSAYSLRFGMMPRSFTPSGINSAIRILNQHEQKHPGTSLNPHELSDERKIAVATFVNRGRTQAQYAINDMPLLLAFAEHEKKARRLQQELTTVIQELSAKEVPGINLPAGQIIIRPSDVNLKELSADGLDKLLDRNNMQILALKKGIEVDNANRAVLGHSRLPLERLQEQAGTLAQDNDITLEQELTRYGREPLLRIVDNAYNKSKRLCRK
jgi:hypothetical protein